MRSTTTRIVLALGLAAAAPVTAAAAPYPIAPHHRAPAAMLRALQRTVVGKYGDGPGLQPFYHQCTRVTARRYDCDWEVNGNGGPGDYRFEYDGSARVVLKDHHWRVHDVVVSCGPDGRHDVCGS